MLEDTAHMTLTF